MTLRSRRPPRRSSRSRRPRQQPVAQPAGRQVRRRGAAGRRPRRAGDQSRRRRRHAAHPAADLHPGPQDRHHGRGVLRHGRSPHPQPGHPGRPGSERRRPDDQPPGARRSCAGRCDEQQPDPVGSGRQPVRRRQGPADRPHLG